MGENYDTSCYAKDYYLVGTPFLSFAKCFISVLCLHIGLVSELLSNVFLFLLLLFYITHMNDASLLPLRIN